MKQKSILLRVLAERASTKIMDAEIKGGWMLTEMDIADIIEKVLGNKLLK